MSKLKDLKIDAPVARPRRRRRVPWVPVVALLFLAAVLLYFQRDKVANLFETSVGQNQPAVEQNDPTAQVTPASISHGPPGSISAAGYLEVIPPGPVIVSTLVAGTVAEIGIVPGQAVTEGEVIARLDSSLLRQTAARLGSRVSLAKRELERDQAGFRSQEVDQANAALTAAQARLDLALSSLERGASLFDKGVISRQEYEELQADVRDAEAGVDSARANLELYESGTRAEDIEIARARLNAAQAELNAVNWEIAQCEIAAPVSGVVLEQFAHPGAWVTPGRDDPLAGAIASIFDPTSVQAWVDVNQRDSANLFVGQAVEMTTDALPERPVAGTVSRIMPQANLQKNTVQVKIEIPDPPADFRPELSIKVTFLSEDSAEKSAATEESGHKDSEEGMDVS